MRLIPHGRIESSSSSPIRSRCILQRTRRLPAWNPHSGNPCRTLEDEIMISQLSAADAYEYRTKTSSVHTIFLTIYWPHKLVTYETQIPYWVIVLFLITAFSFFISDVSILSDTFNYPCLYEPQDRSLLTNI